MDDELLGGNMNSVERRGDTVRRIAGPWTPTVHRLLEHLAAAGIDWIPAPLGVDGDREVLSWVQGEVPVYPLPSWVWTDTVLVDGAVRLRALHDASAGFPREGAVWQAPTSEPAEVICHNDFSPHNLAFRGGAIVGAIDFDFCSPGSRLWDLAYYATRMVPLTDEPPVGAPAGAEMRRRARLVLDSYGIDAEVAELVAVAVTRLQDLAVFSRGKADELARPELRDHADFYERDARVLTAQLADGAWSAH